MIRWTERDTGSVLAILLVGLFLTGCGGKKNGSNNTAVLPQLVTIQVADTTLYRSVLATAAHLLSCQEATLSFGSPGILKGLNVIQGERVVEGQVLAYLDLTDLTAQHDEAVAARLKLEEDLARTERLFQQQVSTETEVTSLRSALDQAFAREKRASFALELGKIRAPFSGIVVEVYPRSGELLAAGTPVLRIVSDAPGDARIQGTAPSELFRAVHPGDTVVVTSSRNGSTAQARVAHFSEAGDSKSGALPFELIPLTNLSCPPGEALQVTFRSAPRKAIALPGEALVGTGPGVVRLYLFVDGVANPIEVELLGMDRERLYVSPEGIEGKSVIVHGAMLLKPRQSVRVEEQ